jgi:hypothetical protein
MFSKARHLRVVEVDDRLVSKERESKSKDK